MIRLTLAEIAAATEGTPHHADPGTLVTGKVEFDSRKVEPGGLFVAFPGARVDGHDFAARAIAQGAVAVLGSRPLDGVPMVLVADQLRAMGRLARLLLDRLPEVTVVGLTGSSGKTTTKDLVAQLATRVGETVAPPGSLNNELGHPYTVLQTDEQTRFLILEMGARGIGHLRYLTEIAPPRVGVVLNVGVAHIGEFGSVDAIARAKGELIEALPPDGVAVLNADDPRVRAMSDRTTARVVLVGETPDATVRAEDVTLDARGCASYTLVTPAFRGEVRLGLAGRHQVGNSLAAAAVAREIGMPDADLPEALGGLRTVSSRRMDVFDRADGVTVIDDSYNANPASTAAALHALAALGRDRRTVAVLGYLAELGEYEREGHEEVGQLAAQLGVDRLIVVGQAAAPIVDGAAAVANWGGESVFATDQEAAISQLRGTLCPGDVVLVKGSRYRTWDVADFLREVDA
jgi:UDP-N-acetylmuramoyl-tripeptide--D-alanyl-D-alanine ligase